jgi:CBS domain-containing membrane protein
VRRRPQPLIVHTPEVTRGLARQLGLGHLIGHPSERLIWAVFTFINCFVTIAILAGVAMALHAPFVFPSLGPTAFLFFFVPRSPAATPRHAVYGHAIGITCGYASLWLFGLEHAATAMTGAVDLHRVLAAALSLSLTGVFMIAFKAVHPPAGATTLIVSLGIVTDPLRLLIIEVAVIMLTLQAIIINRRAGINYPYWALREKGSADHSSRRAAD